MVGGGRFPKTLQLEHIPTEWSHGSGVAPQSHIYAPTTRQGSSEPMTRLIALNSTAPVGIWGVGVGESTQK